MESIRYSGHRLLWSSMSLVECTFPLLMPQNPVWLVRCTLNPDSPTFPHMPISEATPVCPGYTTAGLVRFQACERAKYQKRKIATGGLLQKANYFLLRHTNRIAGGGRWNRQQFQQCKHFAWKTNRGGCGEEKELSDVSGSKALDSPDSGEWQGEHTGLGADVAWFLGLSFTFPLAALCSTWVGIKRKVKEWERELN